MPETSALAVWAANQQSGILAHETSQGYVFAYDASADARAQISLTMPIRLAGWMSRDLHPVFQMNLPEGALLESIRRAIAKVIGDDDLTILRVTGGNQIGRNRFSLPGDDAPRIPETPESLDQLLAYPDARELFHELIDKYALQSGVAGVQPKVLLDARERGTMRSSQFIIKTWGMDYPYLAANEYFCMMAAKRAGLPVPEFYLSENGGLFIVRRFDATPDGASMGFEDMCSLQGLGTTRKYASSYERLAKSIGHYVSGGNLAAAREQFFATLVLSVMVRNGDAHLKNFGVLYETPLCEVKLAPVYDVVTTAAYLKNDVPALTLDGTKKWWPRKALERFASAHLMLPKGTVSSIFEKIADAVLDTQKLMRIYMADHPEFKDIGELMATAWGQGVRGLK